MICWSCSSSVVINQRNDHKSHLHQSLYNLSWTLITSDSFFLQIKHWSLQIAYSGSAYTLMAISVERYLNISNNNKTVWVSSYFKVETIFKILVTISILINFNYMNHQPDWVEWVLSYFLNKQHYQHVSCQLSLTWLLPWGKFPHSFTLKHLNSSITCGGVGGI